MGNFCRDKNGKLILNSISFSSSLDENIELFSKIFENDNTFVYRIIQNRNIASLRCAIFFFDGMVSALSINESIVEPIAMFESPHPIAINSALVATQIIEGNDTKQVLDIEKMMNAFLYGDTVVFVDGDATPIVVNTKGFMTRSGSEPDNEKVLSGPREGFTEAFMFNLGMIRRRLKTPDLKFSFNNVGSQTKTVVCLCYIEGIADKAVLAEIKKRLLKIQIDSVLDSNYLNEFMRDNKFSPFPTIGTTERPDIIAAKILEGRIALIVDGTPVAITAPYIFLENFQSNDDYYVDFLYSNLSRLLRVFGFLLTISIPAIYLALLTFHQEMIPTKLLLSISASRQGVPLSTLLESILLLIVFELLKEAGTRTPSVIGQTLSIVGALVLGQSAVEARFVSAPMVIIIAFAGICALAVPKLKTASLLLRIFLLICASILGLYGFVLGMSIILIHLCKIHSFNILYLTDIISKKGSLYRDVFIRFPWFYMKQSDRFIANKGGNSDE